MYLLRDNPVKAPTGAIRPAACAVILAALVSAASLVVAVDVWAQCPALPADALASSISCRYDEALTRIFTPRVAPKATYRLYVTSAPLEKVAEQLRSADKGRAPASWKVREMDPLEAFGSAAEYDQIGLARLYLGRRARVARGPVVENSQVTASIWLVSPYPDPSFSRLQPGTLIIEFRVTKLGG